LEKIVKWDVLQKIVSSAQSHGKKIVFTNGCFDIIHAGHIKYLRQAKTLGDILVIGLNSDASVSRIKPKRPIIPQDQRAEVLSSLEMVDYITLFDEDTPFELIKFIKPDILVKGGDWKKEDIVGSDIAGETRSLPYIKGISTSEIIKRIKKLE
jgi:D-beta-D-heptose 7-phosphate kinase/D-beta-D-heptose 1-phosphate adenosyltransferase